MNHVEIENRWQDIGFTDKGDGTIIDNITELIWLKNANCFGKRLWISAIEDAYNLESGNCGLVDGSHVGDWRLPSLKELATIGQRLLRNTLYSHPSYHPFIGLKLKYYWSSDEYTDDDNRGNKAWWCVRMGPAGCNIGDKTALAYVWPVRN